MSYFKDVGAFHEKFGLPRHGDGGAPSLMAEDVLQFRTRFMVEELQEFRDACASSNLADAADALADLVYVALGTAHMMRLPFDACWAEVQRANMTKVRAAGADDPRSKRGHAFDVVKPPGFRPPDHGPILSAAAAAALGPTGSVGEQGPAERVPDDDPELLETMRTVEKIPGFDFFLLLKFGASIDAFREILAWKIWEKRHGVREQVGPVAEG